jgi:hypothetical protein
MGMNLAFGRELERFGKVLPAAADRDAAENDIENGSGEIARRQADKGDRAYAEPYESPD